MGKSLVIVESPTKAKTISAFLPKKDFMVESSIGHIRDLPNSAKEIPEAVRGQPWARLGINVDEGFQPVYVVPAEKKKQVDKLKKLIKEASILYLATDEDREGESISWHLVEVLKPKMPKKRLVFHEITREAIQEALRNPRDIDERMVEAQETRRKLDRLYGYEVSPVLWRKIAPRLSAGRVQSVAIRILVEREERRRQFKKSAYWDLVATFAPAGSAADKGVAGERPSFEATLISLAGKRIATGKDFDGTTGELRAEARASCVLLSGEEAAELRRRLEDGAWRVLSVERKPYVRRPEPPFTTSTLQQEANRKLRLSSKETMRAAQRLYEQGLITYMRTDSTTLSSQALEHAREQIERLYGSEYLPASPRRYQTSVKNAQEAHEAIRPAGDFRLPESIRDEVGAVELRVYELIWKRTMACQMAEARGQNIIVQVGGEAESVFQATGKTIEFPGFLRAYVEGADDPEAELADQERLLPDVASGAPLDATRLEAKEHITRPPERFTEASLIKELEANGVGRPSTYASIIDTILRRDYVTKQGNALVPTFIAFAVVGFLKRHFADLIDVQFTARMEDDLDAISLGQLASLPYLEQFYFGSKDKNGLKKLIQTDADARESSTVPIGVDAHGAAINVRIGRYGPFLERGEERASLPADIVPDELTVERAEELLAQGSQGPKSVGVDPATQLPIYVKVGRFGPYVQLGENDAKPKMKSLLPSMKPEELTLEDALRLLALPRSLGQDPETGEEVLADFGRFGPYLRRGKETRSIPKTDDLFTISLERAAAILKEERKGGWRSRTPEVLKELGAHPDSKEPIRVLSGRYGPYVSDGSHNAKIPEGREPASLTHEEAVALLRARAELGPPARKGRKKTSRVKSPTTRKTAAKPRAKSAEGAAASKRSPRKAKKS